MQDNSKQLAKIETAFPQFDTLDWVYQPGITPKEQQYRRWVYQNPTATKIPDRFCTHFEQQDRHDQAQRFGAKVLQEPERHALVADVRKAIDEALPGYASRRKQEAAVAQYIQDKVLPTGQLAEAADLVQKMMFCRKQGVIGVYTDSARTVNEHVVAWDSKCGLSKLCPDEAHQEGKRLSTNYIPAIEHFLSMKRRHTMQFAVFTMPNVPLNQTITIKRKRKGQIIEETYSMLAEAKKRMFLDLQKLLKNFSTVKGLLVVEEDPLAADLESWNVHLNAIMLVDGWLDWKELRKQWVWDIGLYSEEDMIEKTKKSLEKKGIDTTNLTRKLALESAFKELAKYTTKLTGGKSHKTFSVHLKKAPPLVEWPPLAFVEWWKANYKFRRTRSYGILYDPYKYRWNTAAMNVRRLYLEKAGLDLELAHNKWKALDKEQRDLLRDAMDGRIYRDLSGVQWIGSLHIDGEFKPHVKLTAIDLIQEDKSVSEYQRFRNMLPFILGPPEQFP